jgi:hypothetical protein
MALGKNAAVVLAAVVAWGTSTWAADPPPPRVATPPKAASTAAPRRPIMELLEQAGVADTLDKAHINVGGHIEASWTYNLDDPDNNVNPGRIFDFEHNDLTLNQISLFIERKVDPSKKDFDIGGKVEAIWGADSGLIHANGLTDWYDSPRKPNNQLDLTQLYIDFAVPVGNGLLVRVGKMVTHMSMETIDPENNSLYSHSYLFGFSAPFTHTGVMAMYNLSDEWSFMVGFSRGWDQAFEDNNSAIDFLGYIKYAMSKDTTVLLNVSAGPQRTDNNNDWRYVLDLVASHTVSDQLALAVNADFGWEDNAAISGGTAMWYGIAGYGGYKISPELGLNGRIEWFHDDDGARTGISGINLYEVTVGLNVKPFAKDRWGQYLQIRPEIRWDLSSDNVFNDLSDDNQFTFGVDVIVGL